MILLVIAVLAAGIFEIRVLKKDGNNRGIAVFIGLAIITLVISVLYYSKSTGNSFANLFFNVLKISY